MPWSDNVLRNLPILEATTVRLFRIPLIVASKFDLKIIDLTFLPTVGILPRVRNHFSESCKSSSLKFWNQNNINISAVGIAKVIIHTFKAWISFSDGSISANLSRSSWVRVAESIIAIASATFSRQRIKIIVKCVDTNLDYILDRLWACAVEKRKVQ